jgi:hypothetical protein
MQHYTGNADLGGHNWQLGGQHKVWSVKIMLELFYFFRFDRGAENTLVGSFSQVMVTCPFTHRLVLRSIQPPFNFWVNSMK